MDLRTAVNPTFYTAKTTAFMLAGAGDADAKEFIADMQLQNTLAQNSDKDEKESGFKTPLTEEDKKAIMTGSTLSVEARYKAISRILTENGYKNLLDIACGFTPRSLFCEKAGIDYVGMDLPVSAEQLQDFAARKYPHHTHATYVGGDATNAASLKSAANLLHGELMISCEGLILYLSKDEIEQLIGGIREVLKEHGGAWYTSDWGVDYEAFGTFMMSSPETVEFYRKAKEHTMKASNIVNPENRFGSDEELIDFLKAHGMKAEKIPFYTGKEELNSIHALTGENLEKVKELLAKCFVWKMTVDETASVSEKISGAKEVEDLAIQYIVEGEKMTCITRGRIDTISAPALLEIIESRGYGVKSLTVDAARLDYISSAGLRVLLMAVKKFGEVKVINTSDEVKEIFETTGFDQMMTLE